MLASKWPVLRLDGGCDRLRQTARCTDLSTRIVSMEQGLIPRQAPLRSGTEVNARLMAFITLPAPVRRWKLARAIHLTKMI